MARWIPILLVWALAWGCAGVKPWERGRLAHDCMQIVVDADEAGALGKLEATREGASGGLSGGGGGCGCN
ncbi:MAG: DUF4266 domain-containing protein [Bradymonadaceae bacterium]|nr:DUF4266 domain-containing protein [Lujinxingiaceae bacterium]